MSRADNDTEDQDHREVLLQTLDTAISKLRLFVKQMVIPLCNLPPEKVTQIDLALSLDPLLLLSPIKDFLDTYHAQLADNTHTDEERFIFFRALLPEPAREIEFPIQVISKGFLFAKVFRSIIDDLEET